MVDLAKAELHYRLELWDKLKREHGITGVSAYDLKELRIYVPQRGIWVDKKRTSKITSGGTGVAVGLLHTGKSYPDDLTEDGILYHYPNTQHRSHDLSEIDATKMAAKLAVPVFVVTYPTPSAAKRDVHLGCIEGWDDKAEIFLVSFGEKQPPLLCEQLNENEPFELAEAGTSRRAEVNIRTGQQKFKFRVLQRYGVQCAVCDIDVPEVLDAAHIRPKNKKGTDDPRNGLVLCAVHHRALDGGLFAINPDTLAVCCRPEVAERLGITHGTLEHLSQKPHRRALEWLWEKWNK